MNLAVFHPPQLGRRIQAGKLVSPRKDPPSWGRACASLHGKVCARTPDRSSGVAYYAQTATGSIGVPDNTVHFGEMLAIFFRRQGRHHHAGAGPTRLRRMPEHGERPW
jgi:hypothetical protein